MDNKKNAGFIIRFLANKTDSLFLTALLSLPVFMTFLRIPSLDNLLNSSGLNLAVYFFCALMLSSILYTIYTVYLTTSMGGGLGKLLFGLNIVDRDTNSFIDTKTAVYRLFAGYSFSGAFLGIGFLRIFKNPENLAWHDELFNTKVVIKGSWLPGALAFIFLSGYFTYFTYLAYTLFSDFFFTSGVTGF